MRKHGRRYSIRVHPAGLALLLLSLFFGSSGAVLAAALALLWHEAAHMLTMALCGVKRCEIELTPFGGVADAKGYELLTPLRQLASALSGVAASLAAGLVCVRFAPVSPFWEMLWRFNLSLALVNCLPVWPLDGSRAILALASCFGAAPLALKLMRALAYALAASVAALGVWGAYMGEINISLLLAGPYLCYAASEGALSDNVRMMRRAEAAGDKLRNGGILPVRALICSQKPNLLQIARLMRRTPAGSSCLMCVTSPEGKIIETITEKQMYDMIFNTCNEPQKE